MYMSRSSSIMCVRGPGIVPIQPLMALYCCTMRVNSITASFVRPRSVVDAAFSVRLGHFVIGRSVRFCLLITSVLRRVFQFVNLLIASVGTALGSRHHNMRPGRVANRSFSFNHLIGICSFKFVGCILLD